MDQRKLKKLKEEIAQAWRSQQRAADLERLAKRLGRTRMNRGKEPMWINAEFPHLFALAIPHHGGRDLAPGTRRSILEQLEEDALAWEERLAESEETLGDERGIDAGEEDQTEHNGEDDGTG